MHSWKSRLSIILLVSGAVVAFGVGLRPFGELRTEPTDAPSQASDHPADASSGARVYHVGGSYPAYEIEDLLSMTDAVAVIVPTGDPTIHWNSKDDRAWGIEEIGSNAHILSDQIVVAKRTVVGSLPSGEFVLRGLGGTVDDVTMEYDHEPQLESDQEYLALLRFGQFPTKEGSEGSWVLVSQAHGLFTQSDGGGWVNITGLRLAEEQVAEFAR